MSLVKTLPDKKITSPPSKSISSITPVSSVETPDLNLKDFIIFRDYIHEKSGMFFPENKIYLVKNRLTNRMSQLGIKNFKDYFCMVKYDTGMKEFNALMNLLTTNETSFFRNTPQIQAFTDDVLPLLMAKMTPGSTLRLWSAGCSTDAAPYTMLMNVMEKIPNWNTYNIEIIANDISQNVLAAARKGIYHELSLRTTPKYYIDKYFTKKGNVYHIKDIVKKLVKFSQINMIDSLKMSLIKDVDVIFCRNVTIYFSDEVKRKVVKHFYNSLVKGGYYFIGHSESLHGITKAFKLVYLKNGLVYKKE